jgi:hypothetical protein
MCSVSMEETSLVNPIIIVIVTNCPSEIKENSPFKEEGTGRLDRLSL